MTNTQPDTIIAIATPQGTGGIGVIRVSGPSAWNIARQLVKPFPKHPVANKVYPSWLWPEGFPYRIDRCLLLLFKQPHSYTGEQTAELHLHGGQGILQSAIQAGLQHGARQAEPGEFTQRAFLNGRMDLSQAEAVADLIASRSQLAAEAAARQHHGDLSECLRGYQHQITALIALIEAHIDFPDEMDEFDPIPAIQELRAICTHLHSLAEQADRFRAVKDGVVLTIAGLPNSGKSSLLNALLGHKRAIVSDIAGTTRDMVSESMEIDGVVVRLQDTAGLRSSQDSIEQMGVEISREAVQQCELCLYLLPAHLPVEQQQHSLIETRLPRPLILVRSMGDLTDQPSPLPSVWQTQPQIVLSAKCGTGMKDLREAIAAHVKQYTAGELPLLTNNRHAEAAIQATVGLQSTIDTLAHGEELDMAAVGLRYALDNLGQITGETTTEDVIEQIFSRFCVGK